GLPETKFDGYDSLKDESEVIEIYGEDENNLNAGQMGIIVLDCTTFYGEGGGQVGDKGIIYNDNFKAEVYDTKKTGKKVFLHYVKVIEGSLNVGDKVTIEVDELNRRDIMKNHSATHLLHQALKDVVGDHVNQAGSYVDGERLRFDITHFEAVTKEQLEKVEQIVNEKIALGIPVKIDEMSLEQSQSIGARGLFEDKYQDVVRVVQMGDYSKELCGGTHVKTTSDIQMLKILSESSVAAGVRRIEAITGRAVYKYLKDRDSLIDNVKHSLKASNEDEITRRIEMNTEEIKDLKKKLKDITNKDLSSNIDSVIEDAVDIDGTKVCVFALSGLDNNSFRDFGENIKSKLEDGVVILANSDESKVSFITLVTDSAVKKGVFAGDIVREVAKVCGGNGGGRKDFAQAGAKDSSKVEEALQKGIETVKSKINA
ncbi:MAG: DHHA1 domain-containing protein, partial [Finegoldia magna]|nr:DHHA1 domain-containing protein [Finegoldia magna]